MKEVRGGFVSDVDIEIDVDDGNNGVRGNGAGLIRGGKNGKRLSSLLFKNNGNESDSGADGVPKRRHALVRGGCGKKRKRFSGVDIENDDGGVQRMDVDATNPVDGDRTVVNERWEGGIGKWTNQMVDWISSGGDDGGYYLDRDACDDDAEDSLILRTLDGSKHEQGGNISQYFKLPRSKWGVCRQMKSFLLPYVKWVLINVATLMSVSELR